MRFNILLLFSFVCLAHRVASYLEDEEQKSETPDPTSIKLTQETFKEAINLPSIGLFVMFQTGWCGHCKKVQSVWNELSKKHNKLKKHIFARVDCVDQTELCSDNDVLAYPTFMFYKKGSKDGIYYDGERNMESFEDFVLTAGQADEVDLKQRSENDKVANEKPVNDLSEADFKQFVSNGFHFVKFYAPWCGHCQKLAPIWEDLARKYSGSIVKISKVNCDNNGNLCSDLGVRGYPTLMFFSNGQHVETFMNHRTIELLSTFIENMVAAQSSPSENLPSPQTASTPAPPPASDGMDYDLEDQPGEVYMISAKTFDKYLAKGGLVFVKFYAPWCSHCREMEPAWQELARRLSDYKNVRIGKVDCTNNVELCMNQHVQAYPTLVLFKNGFKVEDYLTARDVDSMHSFIARHIKEHEEL